MTPDAALNPLDEQKQIQPPSTAGMTTKVVKGSIWTLAGSVLPLGVAFLSTPFIIRFLGSEAYGVLILVGLIPTYFNFADFGMGVASTRFASEAYGRGDSKTEGEIVWTASAVAGLSTILIAIPLFLFSWEIVRYFNVPEQYLLEGSIALKLTSIAFVTGTLAGVLNSPLLARLRMDLNIVTSAGPKVALAVVTPFILFFGGGIVGAAAWNLIISLLALAIVIYFSSRLLHSLLPPTVNSVHLMPLLKLGGAWLLAMVAGMLLVNLEKLALTGMVSVRALAHYSIAFTFAAMATTFSGAMLQSLIPAFSQMLTPDKKVEFNTLFARGIRINLLLLLPAITVMFVIAKPFFTYWAGAEFGQESSLPFYILLLGLFFNVLNYVPHSAITARGRTDVFAKLYWIELIIYAFVVYALVGRFGIVGAAAAWSLRAIIDACAVTWLSRKIVDVPIGVHVDRLALALGILLLTPPILFSVFRDNFSPWLLVITPVCVAAYCAIAVTRLFEPEERKFITNAPEMLLQMIRRPYRET